MALSSVSVPKGILPQLRNMPRDVFNNIEAIAPAVLPAVRRINLPLDDSAIGLDLDLFNSAAVAGTAAITIDKSRVVTLAPGQAFAMDNVLYTMVEVRRTAAAAISVNVAYAGVSYELLKLLGAVI